MNQFAEFAQVLFGSCQAGSRKNQFFVIRRRPFAKPEQVGVVFPRIVRRRQCGRPQSFHVPDMKHFMRSRSQQASVFCGIFKRTRRNLNDGGVEMLGTAAKSRAHVNHEDIARVGKSCRTIRIAFRTMASKSSRQFSAVQLRRIPKHNLVRNAARLQNGEHRGCQFRSANR